MSKATTLADLIRYHERNMHRAQARMVDRRCSVHSRHDHEAEAELHRTILEVLHRTQSRIMELESLLKVKP